MSGLSVPHDLRPSSLLWEEDLSQPAKTLLATCHKFDPYSDAHDELELIAHRVEALEAQGDLRGCAVVLLHLADLYCESGELGPAQRHSTKAEQLSCPAYKTEHRHNHAVALYSVGLIHHRLGSEGDARSSYRRALEAFEEARDGWISLDNTSRRHQCQNAMGWIRQLSRLVAPGQLRPQPESAEREGVLVPLLKRIPAGKPRLADDCLEGCLIIDKEIVNRASFALQVKGDSMAEAGILDGDVVLMESREDEPPNSRVVAVLIQERETDATLKRFFREGDHIRLEPANKDYPFIVIIDAPDRALEAVIRARYKKSHPGRRLEIYSDVRPQIAGWATGLIRREIR